MTPLLFLKMYIKNSDNISLFLKKEGFVIAGVDVLNGKVVTEINVSNPSVFKNYIEDTEDNFIEHS